MTFFGRARLVQAGTTIAATLLLAATAAPLQAAPAGTGASETPPAARNKDRKICVRVDMSGTRLTRRICRTAAEWEREGGVPRD